MVSESSVRFPVVITVNSRKFTVEFRLIVNPFVPTEVWTTGPRIEISVEIVKALGPASPGSIPVS
jgi:hypothetical protein